MLYGVSSKESAAERVVEWLCCKRLHRQAYGWVMLLRELGFCHVPTRLQVWLRALRLGIITGSCIGSVNGSSEVSTCCRYSHVLRTLRTRFV